MGDIAKGILGGAWTLLVGWILPTALNLSVFFFAVAPSLRRTGPMERLWPTTPANVSLLLLATAVLLGLTLSALRTPLYRILQGYLLWPVSAQERGSARHRQAKKDLQDRLALVDVERRQDRQHGRLSSEDAAKRYALRANPRIKKAAIKDRQRSALRRAMLREMLRRYPVDDEQVAPTRLGNAVRRVEEYGYNRFRLDTQILWDELTGIAPEQVRRQEDYSRANVDFFVAVLTGHVMVAIAALSALRSAYADFAVLLGTAIVLGGLIPLWYRSAVAATDEWWASVRALVNIGRKPLAEALGLRLPPDLRREREMWALVKRLANLPFNESRADLDPYRDVPNE